MTQVTTKRRRSRLPLIIFTLGILLVLLPLFVKAFRVYQLYVSFQNHQATAEQIAAGGVSALDAAEVTTLVNEIRIDTVALKMELEPLTPFTPYLTWIPRVGPILPELDHILEIADAGTVMLVELTEGVSPAIPYLKDQETSAMEKLPDILRVLDNAKPNFARSEPHFSEIEYHLNEILANPAAVEALPWTVKQYLPTVQELMPLAKDGFRLIQVLPGIAGIDGNRTYLLVAQNNDELRPTGGFISGAGPIRVSNGSLGDMSIEDAYQVDDFLNKPYDFPPDPVNEFMTIELFLFRDANFWPDFPTSAKKMMDLYSYGKDIPLDGVIAIDQNFLFALITLLEPIEIPELEMSLTGATAKDFIQEAWAEGDADGEWRTSRKSFLGPMANSIRSKVENDIFSVDMLALADLIQTNIASKSLQVYMDDPAEAAIMAEIGWDGRLDTKDSTDSFMVVDHNMGTNKANFLISNEIEYNIELLPSGNGTATTTARYHHSGQDTGPCSTEQVKYTRGLQYEELVNLCYWNYFRLYVPLNSQLLQATKHGVPAELMLTGQEWPGVSRQTTDDELDFSLIDNFVLIPRNTSQTLQFVYNRPNTWRINSDGTSEYKLVVFKQAGTLPHPPLKVTVNLPEGYQLLESSHQPSALSQSVIQFDTVLDKDFILSVTFE